ncbi:expressed protein [Chlorella variabilis]|uniref:Expressed protein n=1 Tax=Chlorella variabilis TaxID=554065 RepID=E1ZSK3_CHLVA|nr:expressed protein [Chlorella variabilis]EFN51120.1 expressed protein [Chlorella variabilis]|eukprot:XP_005843222.1 expressed protein [Chlorella variabilis]
MDLFSDELVSEVLGLLPPADRRGRAGWGGHALSAVCIQWDRVVRSMQRRLYIDFQQQPGASIGASGGGGEGSGGEEGASDDEGAAAAGSLLEGAALRTIVALVITGLKLPTQEEWIGSLTLLRRLTLGRSPQVPEQLTQLQALTHLGLHRCGDGREGHWSVPAGITALGQLRELQAWGTSLEGDMGALGCLPRLERLDLHESHVDSVGWLQGLTWLTFLRLNNLNNWVTVHAVEAWDAALRPLTLVLDVTDDYGMHHEEALAAALPAVAVDFYRLGCE